MGLGRDEVIAGLVEADAIWPVFDVNGCPGCFTPRRTWRHGICGGCRKLRELHGDALESLEAVTLSTPRDGFEVLIRKWKDRHGSRVDQWSVDLVRRVAAPLSAYLEAHADVLELESARSVVTWIPSSTELIPKAIAQARREGWFAPEAVGTGERANGSGRQRWSTAEQRMAKSADSWLVDPEAARGRDVVLLDDVRTSGSSLHSYAAAVRRAGAERVRGVVLVGNISGRVYQEALSARRARGESASWDPSARWVSD